jgi:hypothetical protein
MRPLTFFEMSRLVAPQIGLEATGQVQGQGRVDPFPPRGSRRLPRASSFFFLLRLPDAYLLPLLRSEGSPWSSLSVSLQASTPEGATDGPASFFLFFFYFLFCKFWNIRWIKKCSDLKILFWKTVQIKICSIRNLFNFELHIQIRKICSNSNLFKFKFVQIRICSIWFFSNLILFRFKFVQTRFCSDSILFKFEFVQN